MRYQLFKICFYLKRKEKLGQAGQAGVQAGHHGRATSREAPATGPAHMAGQGPDRPRPRGRSGRSPGRGALERAVATGGNSAGDDHLLAARSGAARAQNVCRAEAV